MLSDLVQERNFDNVTGLNELDLVDLVQKILNGECQTTKCCASGTDSCDQMRLPKKITVVNIATQDALELSATYGSPF